MTKWTLPNDADDLAAAQGILLALAVCLPLWLTVLALAVWL